MEAKGWRKGGVDVEFAMCRKVRFARGRSGDLTPPSSATLNPNTGATYGTPTKRGGTIVEGLAGGGQQQLR
jgi:hypothetical protein